MSTNFEEAMKARIIQGFKEFNTSYDAWLKWCDTLYESDAHYNFYGKRFTLQQYKDLMRQLMSVFDIELGELDNMLAEEDWTSIRYSVYFTNKKTGVKSEAKNMEFVHFKNNPEPIGARVIEGWALTDNPLSVD
jgi:hypothetical protein